MSAKCKYGDVENVEVVPCTYDPSTGSVTCPMPHKRTTGTGGNKHKLEMDVRFVSDQGVETRRTLVAKYDDEDEVGSDEPLITQENLTLEDEKKQRDNKLFLKLFAKQLATMFTEIIGELLGTFFLTLIICNVVATAVLMNAHMGLWQVAVVCGMGVAISIFCTSHVSDAHLNPAITLAFAIVRFRVFSWKKIVPYICAQLIGGVLAGAVLFGFYHSAIELFEEELGIERGANNSEITAMLFGEYFPNPALYNHSNEKNLEVISTTSALLVEAWTTCILAFVIFCFTDKQNSTVGSGSNKVAVPVLIGITVAILISTYAPLTQVGMNPARDFGPRIFAAFAGWGRVAIPGPRKGFWVYIVGPVIGAPIGALLYDSIVSNAVRLAKLKDKKKNETIQESESEN